MREVKLLGGAPVHAIPIHAITRILAAGLVGLTIVAASFPGLPSSDHDWLQFNFDPQHSGFNTNESTLGPTNVANMKLLFRAKLPATADGAPVYLSGVETKTGKKNLLFLTTKDGHIVALDGVTGSQVWQQQNPAATCRINRGSEPCYTTSSPAVDPNRRYVYTYGLDGRVHKYRVEDGAELTGGGWPQVATLKPFDEKGSSALSIATAKNGKAYLYVTNSGYPGDRGDYQGHVTTIELSSGAQKVFNANCSNQATHFRERPNQPDCSALRSAIWGRPGIVYDQGTNRIYTATGNGPFEPQNHNWGDTVFALNPDGTGKDGNPIDTYTPRDFRKLEMLDLDLGSTVPAILPTPHGSAIRHLAVQGGKDKKLRLLNLENLSGKGKTGETGGEIAVIDVPQGGMILTALAVWVNPADGTIWVFTANKEGFSALRLELDQQKMPHLKVAWRNSKGGTSPIVANSVLFYAGSDEIRALDPTSGKQLWRSNQIGKIHWESPIVANGILYITDESASLIAFSLENTATLSHSKP